MFSDSGSESGSMFFPESILGSGSDVEIASEAYLSSDVEGSSENNVTLTCWRSRSPSPDPSAVVPSPSPSPTPAQPRPVLDLDPTPPNTPPPSGRREPVSSDDEMEGIRTTIGPGVPFTDDMPLSLLRRSVPFTDDMPLSLLSRHRGPGPLAFSIPFATRTALATIIVAAGYDPDDSGDDNDDEDDEDDDDRVSGYPGSDDGREGPWQPGRSVHYHQHNTHHHHHAHNHVTTAVTIQSISNSTVLVDIRQ